MNIAGKRILVTGASSGIGRAIALAAGSQGAKVGVHYSKSTVEALAVIDEIRERGGEALSLKGDLLDPEARQFIVSDFIDQFGGIDVLVNNAGAVGQYRNFCEVPEKEWDLAYELHVKAPFCLSRDAYPTMKRQRWGRIINISTSSLKYAGSNSLHYLASKAALEVLTAGFAKDGARHNVLANTVRCGLIDTPMRAKIPGYSEDAYQKRVGMVPLKRAGRPEEVANMVLFLASECGDFITGETLTVAGGD